MTTLFSPFHFKSLNLKNRIAMAPMTRSFAPDGVVTKDVADYYARRAKADVGFIISEGTIVERPAAKNDQNVPDFYGKEALSAWKAVIDAVHSEGGVMAPQLWHVGGIRNKKSEWQPAAPWDAPSGMAVPHKPFTEPMTDEAIQDTITAYGKAALHAKNLGFEAVELHAAHGYLIDQFFWEGTNIRGDKFGGDSLPKRGKFAAEILKEVRKAVGEDYAVIIRLSQWKQQDYTAQMAKTPQELAAWLEPLVEAGADIFHCSQRRFWETEFEGSDLNFAGWAKKLTGKPTITVGSVGLSGEFISSFTGEGSTPAPLDELHKRLDRGDFDLVAVGRALISDPEWASKIKQGRTDLLNYAAKDLATLY